MQELDYLLFGPVAIIAVGLAEERTVPAIFGFYESDVGVGEDFFPRLGQDADEGIVGSVQYQGGDRDAVDHVSRRRASVVINCPRESAIVRSHYVIEIAQAGEAAQAGDVEMSRKISSFNTQPAPKHP